VSEALEVFRETALLWGEENKKTLEERRKGSAKPGRSESREGHGK